MIASWGGFKTVKFGIKPKSVPTYTKLLKKATWKATKKMGTKVGWPMLEHYGPELWGDWGGSLPPIGDGPDEDPTYYNKGRV